MTKTYDLLLVFVIHCMLQVTGLEGELLNLQKKHVQEKPIQKKATVEMTENRNVERMVPENEYKAVVQVNKSRVIHYFSMLS